MLKFAGMKGLDSAVKTMRKLKDKYPKKLKRGLVTWAEVKVMTPSKEQFVPVDLGNLKNSGKVYPDEDPKKIAVVIGYGDTSVGYAVPVHENPNAHHEVGEYKYLEKPLLQAASTAERDWAAFAKLTGEDL